MNIKRILKSEKFDYPNLQNYPNCIVDKMIERDNEEEKEKEDIEEYTDDEEEQDAEIRNEAWRLCEHND